MTISDILIKAGETSPANVDLLIKGALLKTGDEKRLLLESVAKSRYVESTQLITLFPDVDVNIMIEVIRKRFELFVPTHFIEDKSEIESLIQLLFLIEDKIIQEELAHILVPKLLSIGCTDESLLICDFQSEVFKDKYIIDIIMGLSWTDFHTVKHLIETLNSDQKADVCDRLIVRYVENTNLGLAKKISRICISVSRKKWLQDMMDKMLKDSKIFYALEIANIIGVKLSDSVLLELISSISFDTEFATMGFVIDYTGVITNAFRIIKLLPPFLQMGILYQMFDAAMHHKRFDVALQIIKFCVLDIGISDTELYIMAMRIKRLAYDIGDIEHYSVMCELFNQQLSDEDFIHFCNYDSSISVRNAYFLLFRTSTLEENAL